MKTPITDLPIYWQRQIKNLRAENAAKRIELIEVRAELEALRTAAGR